MSLNAPHARRSRGYIPHYDFDDAVQIVTFRLADSLPEGVARGLYPRDFDDELGRGGGSCLLGDERAAALVEGALLHFDGERYRLGAWVVMPNHVHVLLRTFPGHRLGAIVHSWKSFTAKQLNALRGGSGPVWQREYFDRVVRNRPHLFEAARYVHDNPVAAGLVARPEQWRFGSAREPERVAALFERGAGDGGRRRDAGVDAGVDAGAPPVRCGGVLTPALRR